MEALWFEKEILDIDPEAEKTPKIDKNILAPMSTMRRMVNEEVMNSTLQSGDLAVQLLSSKLTAMVAIDNTAEIEVALARALNAGPGERNLQEMMMNCLPSGDRHIGLHEATSRLNTLMEGGLFKLCSVVAQSKVEELVVAVKTMMRGFPPIFTIFEA